MKKTQVSKGKNPPLRSSSHVLHSKRGTTELAERKKKGGRVLLKRDITMKIGEILDLVYTFKESQWGAYTEVETANGGTRKDRIRGIS